MQGHLIEIVTFDIPYANIGDLGGWAVSVSEDDGIFAGEEEEYAFLIDNLGIFEYNSRFLASSTDTVYLNLLAAVLVYVCLVISRPCRGHHFCVKNRTKVRNAYCWTVLIRIILELTLELCFVLMMSLMFSPVSKVTNVLEGYDLVLTYILASMIFGGPLFILVFFCWNYKKLTSDNVLSNEDSKLIKVASDDKQLINLTASSDKGISEEKKR